jgi:hypothetical protein
MVGQESWDSPGDEALNCLIFRSALQPLNRTWPMTA